nr:MAG TPA: hypothetical protein [Caudoviricetes sp.]
MVIKLLFLFLKFIYYTLYICNYLLIPCARLKKKDARSPTHARV